MRFSKVTFKNQKINLPTLTNLESTDEMIDRASICLSCMKFNFKFLRDIIFVIKKQTLKGSWLFHK